jgi:hypothetical protein
MFINTFKIKNYQKMAANNSKATRIGHLVGVTEVKS